jgi:ribose transport system substrate-binding protein
MKKLLLLILVPALIAPIAVAQGGKKWTIAYMTPGLDVSFWRALSTGIHRAGEALDIKVVGADSRNSSATQRTNVQDLITAGVKAIIISPTTALTALPSSSSPSRRRSPSSSTTSARTPARTHPS